MHDIKLFPNSHLSSALVSKANFVQQFVAGNQVIQFIEVNQHCEFLKIKLFFLIIFFLMNKEICIKKYVFFVLFKWDINA